MPDEKPLPLPLTGAEVKEAILFKVEESLNKTCHLKDDAAYTSFKGEISIKLLLSDYGREQPDNHIVKVAENNGMDPQQMTDLGVELHQVDTTTKVEPAPPNQVRVDTGQGVPVQVTEKGKKVTKHLKYAARKQAKTANAEKPNQPSS